MGQYVTANQHSSYQNLPTKKKDFKAEITGMGLSKPIPRIEVKTH